MDYNDKKPTEKMLGQWTLMTEGNKHHQVRNEIGKWAEKNCKTKGLKGCMTYCRLRIDYLYTEAETTGEQGWEELEESNKCTSLLLDAIGYEYGWETKELIASTL